MRADAVEEDAVEEIRVSAAALQRLELSRLVWGLRLALGGLGIAAGSAFVWRQELLFPAFSGLVIGVVGAYSAVAVGRRMRRGVVVRFESDAIGEGGTLLSRAAVSSVRVNKFEIRFEGVDGRVVAVPRVEPAFGAAMKTATDWRLRPLDPYLTVRSGLWSHPLGALRILVALLSIPILLGGFDTLRVIVGLAIGVALAEVVGLVIASRPERHAP